MEPGESGAAGRRRAAFVHRDPRPGPWRPATARSLPQSAGGLATQCRKAARPSRRTARRFRCHRDDLRPWGVSGGRRVWRPAQPLLWKPPCPGSGRAGGTGLAGQTGRLTPARVFAGIPGPATTRASLCAPGAGGRRRRGPGAQMAAFTSEAPGRSGGKGARRQAGANLPAEAPEFRTGRG